MNSELAMLNPTFVRRILALSCTCVAALVLSVATTAQTPDLLEPEPALEELVAFTFEGSVHAPDGTPAEGAIVVSASGGQAVTDRDGGFRLEVRVPPEAESVRVTAVGQSNGKLLATQLVSLSAGATNVTVAPLQLAQASSCEPSWLPTFGQPQGTNGHVYAFAVFDDGRGLALYVGGDFYSAGGNFAGGIVKWDGASWVSIPWVQSGKVYAMTVFDDGNGPKLIVGGDFLNVSGSVVNHIAAWDGLDWSPLAGGLSGLARSLETFDDGNGERLFVGGAFGSASGVTANRIAKWDGASWSSVGSGVSYQSNPTASTVSSLAVFDDGGGDALFVGGIFTVAGGVAASSIATWDGSGWASVGTGLGGVTTPCAKALSVFDDGTGEALIVGGDFTSAGGVPASRIAKWDGANWAPLGVGTDGEVESLTVFDGGSGPELIAGGFFTSAGGVAAESIARWNGSTWQRLGSGVTGSRFLALAVMDVGGGPVLYAGGNISTVDGLLTDNIAQWDGSSWSPLGNSVTGRVYALTVFDDGGGDALYAAGLFLNAGGVVVNGIAKWNGSRWAALGGGVNLPSIHVGIRTLAVFDDGSGEALYAGGMFSLVGGPPLANIAKWDGSNWSALGSGVNGFVFALTVFDDGNGDALYAGGGFTSAGGVGTGPIAKWDGSNWTGLGSGLDFVGFGGPSTYALAVADDGTGEALYVGGIFTHAGGVPASRIAKWDGSTWSSLGSGVNGPVRAIVAFDDGGGPSLCVAGQFTRAGGAPASRIAKWDGSTWSALGSGMNKSVFALSAFNDGNGEALFAGGNFVSAGGTVARGIARWDGVSWSSVGPGVNRWVFALTILDDGTGSALYVGGDFTDAYESRDAYIAKWGCPLVMTQDFCNGDGGDGLGCSDCPCSNNATPGTIGGCLNSASQSTRLFASGDPAVNLLPNDTNDLRFSLTGAQPGAFCILNSGDALAPDNAANPCFGLNSGTQAASFDGLRCAVTNTRRHGGRAADSNGEVGATNDPWGGEGGPAAGIANAGGGFVAGQTRFFQVIHRDDPLAQCMRGLNTSQAVSVLFTPGL